MFGRFDHYVSFGTTDQQTLLARRQEYDGLLVPGTVAAFQKQGTGGFVLSLSAGSSATPYVIDPRTPLFQQPLPQAKKSHHYLAAELGDPTLVSAAMPTPAGFTSERVERIAQAWVEFNRNFRSAASEKFSKYAKRLGESVAVPQSRTPEFVLPPYFMSRRVDDDWWETSKRFLEVTRGLGGDLDVVPVVAAKRVEALGYLLGDLDVDRAVIWVSDLHELRGDEGDLADYARTIRAYSDSGMALSALYGGFFSVLLGAVGLKGSSHGIGYGEHRSWVELPQSGPPPARYYALPLHRYVAQDVAERLNGVSPSVVACPCDVCDGKSPLLLDYHELMQHSVLARQSEIDDWVGLSIDETVDRLEGEYLASRAALGQAVSDDASLPGSVGGYADHLGRWLGAIESL